MTEQDQESATGRRSKGIVGVIIAAILLGISSIFGINLLTSADEGPRAAGEWYEIYFTDPSCPRVEERRGGLEETVAEDILQAQTQVDIAAFDFDALPMVDALIVLEKRGIIVRVVTDEDNSDLSSIRRLRRSGISVVEDRRSALMHNKFVIIDGRYLWTGSMNFTSNGAYCNNNNLVRIDSPELAANYTAEMNEMYVDRSFGPTSPANTPKPRLTLDAAQVANYFSSEEAVSPILADLVDNAAQEVLFMAFSFTDEEIGEAVIGRAEAGIPVRGVFETTGSESEFSYFGEMESLGLSNLQVRQDGNPRIMHHKVIIIDRRIVVFGSFNFSSNANDSNDENVVIISDPAFAGFFIEEFEAVWDEAKP